MRTYRYYFAILWPDGFLMHWTIYPTKKEAISKAIQDGAFKTWEEGREKDYKCVKVKVVEYAENAHRMG